MSHQIKHVAYHSKKLTSLSLLPLKLVKQTSSWKDLPSCLSHVKQAKLHKIFLVLFVSFKLFACASLPKQPHTADSLQLDKLLQQRYALNNTQVLSHTFITQDNMRTQINIDSSTVHSTEINNAQTKGAQINPNHADDDIYQPNINFNEELLTLTTTNQQVESNPEQASPSPNTDTNTKLATTVNSEPYENIITKNSEVQPVFAASDLEQAITEQVNFFPSLSGYYPLLTGEDAYAFRSKLNSLATKSIDIQYYIWHNDLSGQLMLKQLWEAAERGVIVRLLLDDFNSNAELDQLLLRFASHPNIAVRLMNPISHRKLRALDYLTNFKRINHRMHNKSMTFDRKISIIGGRNIGNEYLSDNADNHFSDLDVLLIGNVVDNINLDFEQYWRSPLAFDVQTLVKNKSSKHILQSHNIALSNRHNFLSNLDLLYPKQSDKHLNPEIKASDDIKTYENVLQHSTIDTQLIEQTLPFRWAEIIFLSDDVRKLNNNANSETYLVYQLRELLGKPTQNLTIVSSYFVPTHDGVNALIRLANQGVNIKILTNSYNATDVGAVHAGYAEWRKTLLTAGIELYELKAVVSEDGRENKLWRTQSQSSTSLHAKTFTVDDNHVFIGSYNVDPRSADINTEMGVVINDALLAKKMHSLLNENILNFAYKVTLTQGGELQWQTIENHKFVYYDREPEIDSATLFILKIMSLLPIDWLL